MWPFVDDVPSAIELLMLIVCVPMGLSHVVRPAMWQEFFGWLAGLGTPGLVLKTLAAEIWPGALIVAFHPVWWGPGLLLTLYGWVQLTKVVVVLLRPEIGMRSMAMAQTHSTRGFTIAGALLIGVGVSAGTALLWP